MRRTCSRCSALRCRLRKATPDCCPMTVNGWDIEWKPSGLKWIWTCMGWTLKSGRSTLGYLRARGWYDLQPDRDLVVKDARALVAAVKGAKDG